MLAQMETLMRAIMNFYNNQDLDNLTVLERMREYDSDKMIMDRLQRAIFDSCDEECKATPARYAIWGEDI